MFPRIAIGFVWNIFQLQLYLLLLFAGLVAQALSGVTRLVASQTMPGSQKGQSNSSRVELSRLALFCETIVSAASLNRAVAKRWSAFWSRTGPSIQLSTVKRKLLLGLRHLYASTPSLVCEGASTALLRNTVGEISKE